MAENKDTWFENTAVCIDDFSYPRLKLGEVYIVKDIDIESETVIIEIDGYQDYPINFFQINIVDKRTVGGIKEVDKDISELEDEIE
jgi:hypothetical protein